MFDVHDCIAFLTNRGAKAVCEAMNDQFKRENLTRTQWTALYFIGESRQITQKGLAEILMISEPSATHLVERLEQAQLIQRAGDPGNFRVKLLSLTEKGEHALHSLLPLVEQFNSAGTRSISESDLETFKRVMEQMIRNTQDMEERREPL